MPAQSGVACSVAAKSEEKAPTLSAKTLRMCFSVGAKPKSGVIATLSEARSIMAGLAKSSGRRIVWP